MAFQHSRHPGRLRDLLPALGLILAVALTACSSGTSGPTATTTAQSGPTDVILATTTSTQDSGLLDVLEPEFEKATGYNLKVIAVGTGQALAMGERGDADVLLVHAPTSEKKVVASGAAINRRLVMHNDFIIVGPKNDPAGIKGMTSARDALKRVADTGARFISRGDDSGTDKLEKSLWQTVGLDPTGEGWYEETGQGMGATLQVAGQRGAYTISDRGTFLAQAKNLDLVLLVEGDPLLLNVYSVMQVNPERFGRVNGPGGKAFADFMVSDQAQAIIGTFGADKFGQPLFVPDAKKTYADLGLEP